MKRKNRIFFGIFMTSCIIIAMTSVALAAYFAKGKFKDVFVNKQDFFSADVLYSISSLDDPKHEVGSSGVSRQILVYNHDVASGEFNSFDVTFDVYAWLAEELPAGKEYTISDENGTSVAISTVQHEAPVLQGLTLPGGKRSSVTLTVEFCFQEGDDISRAPGLNVVAVPTAPKRLSNSILGATICPTWSEAFDINSDFEQIGDVKDYAAFTYKVNTVGNAPDGDKILIKWKSDALILIKVNGKDPGAVLVVQEGNFGDGFDRMIVLDAQSNNTDSFIFFRNTDTENNMWKTENLTWDDLRAQISTQYIKTTQE